MKLRCLIFSGWMLASLIMAGCGHRSVVCFVPKETFTPKTGKDLFEQLKTETRLDLKPNHFLCKKKNSLVGWIVADNDAQKQTIKDALKKSASLKRLQVEDLDPAFWAIVKSNWRQSQNVRADDIETTSSVVSTPD